MRSKIYAGSVLALAVWLAAGCAPLPAQNDVAWRSGAKHGWVSGFYDAGTPRAALPKCLADLPPEQFSGHLFVKIDYRSVRRMMVEVAALPGGVAQTVRLGDRVELWPQDCARGRLSRISKMMPAPGAGAPAAGAPAAAS
ncbi:MAG TPA: hypothetical protein VGP06_12830 [Janthinobacterium sp.]|nr:hypothetical protein [Janthinobacterium sp.]